MYIFSNFFLQELYISSFYLPFLQVLYIYSQSQKYLDTNICLTLYDLYLR